MSDMWICEICGCQFPKIVTGNSNLDEELNALKRCSNCVRLEAFRKEVRFLNTRIAALRKAQEWTPSTEPPSPKELKEGITKQGLVYSVRYVPKFNCYATVSITGEETEADIIGWRDLPALPENDA